VWGSGPADVWAFGNDEAGLAALRFDGHAWRRSDLLDAATLGAGTGSDVAPYAAWGSGPDDIWVGVVDLDPLPNGNGTSTSTILVHWNGQTWTRDSTLPAQIAASLFIDSLWGTGPNDVWGVGSVQVPGGLDGGAIHWDGTRWSGVTSLSAADRASAFDDVWASGPNDVWIGGGDAVHHWNGQAWSKPVSSTGGGGYLVGGSGADDVWAVMDANDGSGAVASRWNGTEWRQFVVPGIFPRTLTAISPTNAWLVGDEIAFHWDGQAWTPSDAGSTMIGAGNLYWDGQETWAIAMWGLIRHP
jgi:hypothetical protein